MALVFLMKTIHLNFVLIFIDIQFFLRNIHICIVAKKWVKSVKEIGNVHRKVVEKLLDLNIFFSFFYFFFIDIVE